MESWVEEQQPRIEESEIKPVHDIEHQTLEQAPRNSTTRANCISCERDPRHQLKLFR